MSDNTKDELIDDNDVLKENNKAYETVLNADGRLTAEQKEKVKRLEFSSKTKRVLAQRVGYRCSCPKCTNITIGPGNTLFSVAILGEAAHIVGAVRKEDGLSPRADATKTEDQIKSLDNGIWLCRHHHELVDSKESKYTVEVLKAWKKQAEEEQAKLMERKPPDFVNKYILPKIETKKGINSIKLGKGEWCLLAYLMEHYDDSICYYDLEGDCEGRNFFDEYQNWMSKKSIRAETSQIRFNAYPYEMYSDVRDVVNKLTGLVVLSDRCLSYGEEFDEFWDQLYNDDEECLEKIISSLKII